MTGGNWARLNEVDSDTTALANTMKERLRDKEWREEEEGKQGG